MKRALLFWLAFLFFHASPTAAQNVTDKEIEAIVNDLILKLQKKGFNKKKIAVEDFTDKSEQTTMLGSFLADEFSNALVNNSSTFTVIEKQPTAGAPKTAGKSGLRKTGEFLDQAGNSSSQPKDPNSIEIGKTLIALDNAISKKGKTPSARKGLDAVVVGTLTEFTSNFRLNVKVIDLKDDDRVLVAVNGDITRTESIDEIAGQTLSKKGGRGGGEVVFRKDDLSFSVLECRQAGQDVDLILEISNVGEGDLEIFVYSNTSRIIDSEDGKEYKIGSIRLAEKVHSREVQKTILAGTPVKATVTFSGVRKDIELLSKIELYVWSGPSGYFHVELRDVGVSR